MRQSGSAGGTWDAGGVAGEGRRGQRPRAAGHSGSRRRAPRARGGGAPARGSRTDHRAVCKLGRSLFFSLARASPASTLTSRGAPSQPGLGSPPIQPAAKSSSWKLPMAGAAAPRAAGAGSVPSQSRRRVARDPRVEGGSGRLERASRPPAIPVSQPHGRRASARTSPSARGSR